MCMTVKGQWGTECSTSEVDGRLVSRGRFDHVTDNIVVPNYRLKALSGARDEVFSLPLPIVLFVVFVR